MGRKGVFCQDENFGVMRDREWKGSRRRDWKEMLEIPGPFASHYEAG